MPPTTTTMPPTTTTMPDQGSRNAGKVPRRTRKVMLQQAANTPSKVQSRFNNAYNSHRRKAMFISLSRMNNLAQAQNKACSLVRDRAHDYSQALDQARADIQAHSQALAQAQNQIQAQILDQAHAQAQIQDYARALAQVQDLAQAPAKDSTQDPFEPIDADNICSDGEYGPEPEQKSN